MNNVLPAMQKSSQDGARTLRQGTVWNIFLIDNIEGSQKGAYLCLSIPDRYRVLNLPNLVGKRAVLFLLAVRRLYLYDAFLRDSCVCTREISNFESRKGVATFVFLLQTLKA